jgi:hypothetical protein
MRSEQAQSLDLRNMTMSDAVLIAIRMEVACSLPAEGIVRLVAVIA